MLLLNDFPCGLVFCSLAAFDFIAKKVSLDKEFLKKLGRVLLSENNKQCEGSVWGDQPKVF